MRLYNIISGVLLILPIIDLALTAPVLVRENCQACADVVQIPEDVVAVLGKRGDPLDLLGGNYVEKLWGKPESSATHAPSSSAPSVSNHGPTDVVQEPAPNLAPSTVNPDHGPTNVMQAPVLDTASSIANLGHGSTDVVQAPEPALASPTTNSDHGSTNVVQALHLAPSTAILDHGSTNIVQTPVPDSASSTTNLDHGPTDVVQATEPDLESPTTNSDHGSTNVFQALHSAPSTANLNHELIEPSSPSPAASPVHGIGGGSEPAGSDDHYHAQLFAPGSPEIQEVIEPEITEVHTSSDELNLNPRPSPDSSFDWDHWQKMEDPASPGVASSKSSKKSVWDWLGLMSPLPKPLPPSTKSWKSKPSTKSWNSKPSWKSWNIKSLPKLWKPKPSSKSWNLKSLSKFWKPKFWKSKFRKPKSPPSTDSSFDWTHWTNKEDPVSSKPKSSKPKSSKKSVWNYLGLSNPRPRPQAPASSKPLSPKPPPDAGPLNPGAREPRLSTNLDWHPNLMMAQRPPPPLKYKPPNTESPNEPTEADVVHEPPLRPDPKFNSKRQPSSRAPDW